MIPANTRPLEGRAPRLKAPAGATDCHTHLFLAGFEGHPQAAPIKELATLEDFARYQRWMGLDRAVVTQSNAYQFDNGALLASLDQLGLDKARGVAVVAPDTPLETLEDWHARGVRGARIMNLGGGAMPLARLPEVEPLIAPLGWHLMVQFNGRELDQHLPMLERIQCPYIIDHIGKFIDPVPADDPRVDAILRLLDRGNAWFKICAAYETSLSGGPDYDDVGAIARRVIDHAPERILWGSNWPHVGVMREQYPDDPDQLDVLLAWANEQQRQRILVDNPAELYGFGR